MSGEVGFDGKSPPSLLPAVGSFCPIVPFKATPENATSMSITFASLRNIKGWIIQFSDSNGAILGGDSNGALGPIVSASGNVLTIADGTDLDISAHTGGAIHGFVWGDARV